LEDQDAARRGTMVGEKKERTLTKPKGGNSSAKTGDVPDLLGLQYFGIVVDILLHVGRSDVEISETPKRRTFALLHQPFQLRFALTWVEMVLGRTEP
jgi:hypothetical protein